MEGMYQIFFYGGLILAIGLFITTVVLFFVLKIPHTIGDLTGSNARKSIKGMNQGTSRTLNQSVTKKEQAKYYNVGADKITVKETSDEAAKDMEILTGGAREEVTEVLGAGRFSEMEEETTEVLGAGRFADPDEDQTDVLKRPLEDDEATDVLATEDGFDGDAATDVLASEAAFDGDAATDVLVGSYGDDDTTDVLTSEDLEPGPELKKERSWDVTAVKHSHGITNPKIRVITDIVVTHTNENL